MAPPISRDILNKESNARFWAQTGWKVGQPLDPKNPLDKPYTRVWMDIFRKVKAEADAGTLITTYDQPTVAQSLSDAHVADQASVMHTTAAANAIDPVVQQQNISLATAAVEISAQKAREAAEQQPPTASPTLVHEAKHEIAKTPPPPSAPAQDQIAHAKASAPAKPDRRLIDATNNRFWLRYGYKVGQRLDMSDPEDVKMSKKWMEIFREVQREADEGRLVLTPMPPVAPTPMPPVAPTPMPPVAPTPMPPTPPTPPTPPMQPMQPMQPMPALPTRPTPAWPTPPTRPVPAPMPMQQPWLPGMPMQRPWPPLGMRPVMPTPTEAGPPGPAPLPPEARPVPTPTPTPTPTEAPPEAPPEGMSTVAKIALGLFGLAGAAAIIYAATRQSSRGSTSRSPRRESMRESMFSTTARVPAHAFPGSRSTRRFDP